MGLEPGARFNRVRGEQPGPIVIHVQPSLRQLLDRAQELGRQMKQEHMFQGRDLSEKLIAERAEEML